MESTSNNPTCTWLTLPPEMRQHIYNRLPQEDALNVNLTWKQMQEEIESFFVESEVKINEHVQPNIMKIIQNRRIRCIRIFCFKNPPEILPIFTFPKYINTLHVDLSTGISSQNLHSILLESCKYLRSVNFTLTKENREKHPQSEPPYMSYHYNYRRLRNLKICWMDSLNWHPERFSKFVFEYTALSRILTDVALSSCPLNTIDVRLGVLLFKDVVFVALFSVIARYFNTLSVLRINSQDVRDPPEQSNLIFKNFDSGVLKKVDSLSEINFYFESCDSLTAHLIGILLGAQKKLKILKLVNSSLSTYNSQDIFIGIIGELTLKSSESLTYISINIRPIHGITQPYNRLLDFSLFKDCRNLKTLEFMAFPGHCVACNLHTLPKALETLALEGFSIPSEEMGEDFSNNSTSLKTLKLTRCQDFQSMREIFEFSRAIFVLPHLLVVYLTPISQQGCKNFQNVGRLLRVSPDLGDVYNPYHFYFKKIISCKLDYSGEIFVRPYLGLLYASGWRWYGDYTLTYETR